MAELVQSHAAPDLLSFDEADIDGFKQMMVRVGTVSVPVHYPSPGERNMVTLSVEHLRKLHKEVYRLGWNGKCVHVRALVDKIPAEIGT